MKRVVALGALVLAMVGWSVPGHALIGTLDQVPAATLLLPYFEVDLDNPNGLTTLMAINNASSTAALAHVIVWTDLSVPTLSFNIYLTGYDVQTINLRDIFVNGVLPRTASAQQDTGEAEPNPAPTPGAISNQGQFSNDVTFASCFGFLPYPTFAQVLADHGGDPLFDYILHLQQAHTGQPSLVLGNLCSARNLGDRIARGYITVDTVNNCTLQFPSDPGYFINGGLGSATNQNLLWGDYFYVTPGQNFAQGNPLVHIEASPGQGVVDSYPAPGSSETTTAGEYTFYGRYVAWSAADNREPLATTFATRFLNGGVFSGGTDLIVWRDSKVNQFAFLCPAIPGVRPPWFPLGQEQLVIFDEQESRFAIPPVPFSPAPPIPAQIPFPAEAQRVAVGGPDLPVPYNFGWLYLSLSQSNALAGANPPEDPIAAQGFIQSVHSAEGRFSVGYDAILLDSAANASHIILP
jgi:hypothetical protein